MKRLTFFLITVFFVGIISAQVKNVAVVEMEIDAQSGAAAEITPAEVRLMTAGLRREAVKNLPKERYNIMTSETVYAQGGAVLEACADENCVITLGSKIGADYIVRGIISKLRARFALSVEIYETENGNLVASSELVSSENVGELVEKAAGACAEMYKTFANATQSVMQKPTVATAETADQQLPEQKPAAKPKPERKEKTLTDKSGGEKNNAHWSWGKFPPKEAGRGEARIDMSYDYYQDTSFRYEGHNYELGLSFDARYSIIQGLEVVVVLPVPMMRLRNGDIYNDYAGLSHPRIGIRYWLPVGFGFFSEFMLPIDTRDTSRLITDRYYVDYHDYTPHHLDTIKITFSRAMGLELGAQYSKNVTEKLSFGSQFSLMIPFASQYNYTASQDLNVGAELDYTLGMITPFLGVDMLVGITRPTSDGKETGEIPKMGVNLSAGANVDITKMLSADIFVGIRFGERYSSSRDYTTVRGHISFNF